MMCAQLFVCFDLCLQFEPLIERRTSQQGVIGALIVDKNGLCLAGTFLFPKFSLCCDSKTRTSLSHPLCAFVVVLLALFIALCCVPVHVCMCVCLVRLCLLYGVRVCI